QRRNLTWRYSKMAGCCPHCCIRCRDSSSTSAVLCRESNAEARAAIGRRFLLHTRTVMLRDLAHQRQAQSPAAGMLAAARGTVERLEHPLALGLGDSRAVVA